MGSFVDAEVCCAVGKTKKGGWRVQCHLLCRELVKWGLSLVESHQLSERGLEGSVLNHIVLLRVTISK